MFKPALIAASAAALLAVPGTANAQYYPDPYYGGGYNGGGYHGGYSGRGYDNGYNGQSYYGGQHCSGTTGTVVGGVAGAVLGSRIARGRQSYDYYGNRGGGNATTGALIGGAVGALLGRKVDKDGCKRRNGRSYGYRY